MHYFSSISNMFLNFITSLSKIVNYLFLRFTYIDFKLNYFFLIGQVDLEIWTSPDLPVQSIEEVPSQVQEIEQVEAIAPRSLFVNNGLNVEKSAPISLLMNQIINEKDSVL